MTPGLKTETADLPILVSAFHKYVTYLLTYLDTYPLTYSSGSTCGPTSVNSAT